MQFVMFVNGKIYINALRSHPFAGKLYNPIALNILQKYAQVRGIRNVNLNGIYTLTANL